LVIIVLIATEAMARSRAGLILTIVALAGIFALASANRRKGSGVTPGKLVAGATILAITLAVQFALYRILERFDVDPLEDARIPFAHNTIEAAKAFMPFGSGLGTFIRVYGMFEKPSDTFASIYANHAHNDILEVWLETGVIGMGLLGLFVIWIGFRSVKVWSRPAADATELDRSLIRAATIVIVLLIAHSFVDYPLRTGAMMAVLAFSCALLIEPLAGAEDATRVAVAEPGRARVPRRQTENVLGTTASWSSTQVSSAPSARATEISKPQPRQPGARWGEDIEWPVEWQDAKEQRPPETTKNQSSTDS
jgi:O-antigen ligase